MAAETLEWVEHYLDEGCVSALFDLMWECQRIDEWLVCAALDALGHILDVGSQKQARSGLPQNPFVVVVEHTAAWPLEEMLRNPNSIISERARQILQRHWPSP